MTIRAILIVGLLLFTVNSSFGQATDSSLKNENAGIPKHVESDIDSATVYVSFIVETTGKITNVKVDKIKCRKCKKELKDKLKSEALRVVSTMPDRNPNKERVKFIQPIKFALNDE